MAIDKNNVEYTARLARIELQSKELEKLAKQLQEIVGFMDKLKELDVEGINPTSHILPMHNVLREDIQKVSLPVEKALMNAPQKEGNFFVIPKVIE